jgi:hypothetical protein
VAYITHGMEGIVPKTKFVLPLNLRLSCFSKKNYTRFYMI